MLLPSQILMNQKNIWKNLEQYIKIQNHFLEPKTPVKEALFRLFVYNNNKPLTVKQISKQLSELWEMSQFPRDIGEEKLSNLLKNISDYYIQPYGRKFYIKKY